MPPGARSRVIGEPTLDSSSPRSFVKVGLTCALVIAVIGCGRTIDQEGDSGGARAATTSTLSGEVATKPTTSGSTSPITANALAIREGDLPYSSNSNDAGTGGADPNSLQIVIANYEVGCTGPTYYNYAECNAWRVEILIPPELAYSGASIDLSSVSPFCFGSGMPKYPDSKDCSTSFGGCLEQGTLEVTGIDEKSVQLTLSGTTFPPGFFSFPDLNGNYSLPICPSTH